PSNGTPSPRRAVPRTCGSRTTCRPSRKPTAPPARMQRGFGSLMRSRGVSWPVARMERSVIRDLAHGGKAPGFRFAPSGLQARLTTRSQPLSAPNPSPYRAILALEFSLLPAQSALLNVMEAAARKAGRSLKRDFGEVANLQVSLKGPANFVSA